MSGKKRIYVDEDAWNEATRKANQLRQVQRDLPGMLASVQRAQEQQAARDRAAFQARQDEMSSRLAKLSAQTRRIEETTTRRINEATAAIMNETRQVTADLRSETRTLVAQQEQRFSAAMSAERAERQRDSAALRQEIELDRAVRADVLATAGSVVADARVLHDAIAATLPHERFVPGRLDRLRSDPGDRRGECRRGHGRSRAGDRAGAVPRPRRSAGGRSNSGTRSGGRLTSPR